MDKKGRQLRQQATKKKCSIVGTSTNIRWIKNLGRASLVLKSYIRAALFGTNTNICLKKTNVCGLNGRCIPAENAAGRY